MLRLARTTRRACVDTKEVHASGFFGECWRRRRGVDAPVSQLAHVCGRSPVSGVAGSHRAVATSAGVAAGASVGSARTCLCLSSHPLEVLQHAVDTRQIAVVLAQSVERNTGAPVGTGSGPIDLLALIDQGVATDELLMQVTRAYRKLAMFVGLLVTGFEGAWITKEGCYKCGHRGDTARCCRCQCGICEGCGEFLAQASQKQVKGKWEWLGSSTACCEYSYGCKERQEQIIDFWKKKSGEAVQ